VLDVNMTMIMDQCCFYAFNYLHNRMTCYCGFFSDKLQHWVKPRSKSLGYIYIYIYIYIYDNDYWLHNFHMIKNKKFDIANKLKPLIWK
jgi:hypothetical protein